MNGEIRNDEIGLVKRDCLKPITPFFKALSDLIRAAILANFTGLLMWSNNKRNNKENTRQPGRWTGIKKRIKTGQGGARWG